MLAALTTQTRPAIVRLLLILRGPGLRRADEATASEESLESRVCSIGIPLGVDGQKYEMDITRGVGLVEPVEGHISLSEPRVDECHRIRRNVLRAGDGLQCAQHFSCLVRAPKLRQKIAPQRDGLAVVIGKPTRDHAIISACKALSSSASCS